MKQYSTRELKKIVTENGFVLVRTNGDHFIYKREDETIVINKNINICVANRLIKQHKLKERN